MKRIVVKVIVGIALALSLAGTAWGANWNSGQDPKPAAVNWNSAPQNRSS